MIENPLHRLAIIGAVGGHRVTWSLAGPATTSTFASLLLTPRLAVAFTWLPTPLALIASCLRAARCAGVAGPRLAGGTAVSRTSLPTVAGIAGGVS